MQVVDGVRSGIIQVSTQLNDVIWNHLRVCEENTHGLKGLNVFYMVVMEGFFAKMEIITV